jgi:hypothetical protein
VLWCLAVLPASAWAACGIPLPALVRNAYPGAVAKAGGYELPEDQSARSRRQRTLRPEDVTCAVWPSHPAMTLAAVRFRPGAQDVDQERADLDVLVLETGSGRVLHRLFQRGGADWASARADTLAIDTTPYRLNSKVTAFGVLMSHVTDSVSAPYSLTTLQLYVIENGALRRVLSDFHTAMQRGESKGACDGWFETHTVSLSRGQSASNGMWDWLVTTQVARSTRSRKGNTCESRQEPVVSETAKLSYRGRQYYLED